MIRLTPFRAVRPERDKAGLVASRSYVSYDDQQLNDKLLNNPYTFLHVIHPDTANAVRLEGEEKFKLVRKKFEEFSGKGIFFKDAQAGFYLYQQQNEHFTFTGIIAAVAVEDYHQGRILKHEHTITRREEMFKNYLRTTGFNAEPVLLMHRESGNLKTLLGRIAESRPEYEFSTTDAVSHRLWPIFNSDDIAAIQSIFGEMEKLYIADGHHRCASSAILSDELRTEGRSGPFEYFLSYLIPESNVHIHGFHRLIRTLKCSTTEFLSRLEKDFTIRNTGGKGYEPDATKHIGLYIDGKWFELIPRTGSFDAEDPVASLDAEILSRNVLGPLLGIEDLRNDPQVDFMPGDKGCTEIEKAVDSEKFQCGFALYPVTTAQLRRVSDKGCIMPPKSTYIEPKLRSGLTIYDLFEA